MNVGELQAICHLVVELTRLRQAECKHLCIETFAPELMASLIRQFMASRAGGPK